MGRDTFVFYPSFLDGIEQLPEAEQLKAYRMIAHYGIYGEAPKDLQGIASAVYYMAIPSIDSAKKNRKNGAKGGRPPKNASVTNGYVKEKPKVSESENQWLEICEPLAETYEDVYVDEEVYVDENIDINENIITNMSENISKIKKEVRHKYGTYNNVLLSDIDIEKLQSEFPVDYQERIERLSEYMESTGKSYKNHLATIRSWAKKNADKKIDPLAMKTSLQQYVLSAEDVRRDAEAQQYLKGYMKEQVGAK